MKEAEPEPEAVLRYARVVAKKSGCHSRHVDEIAEDAQEIWLDAREQGREIGSWRAWIREIVRRLALRWAGREAGTEPQAAIEMLSDPGSNPIEALAREARALGEERYIEHARTVLPLKTFELVRLVLETTWSVGRIARVAGVEKKRAREILLSAVKKLRKYPPPERT